MRCSEPGGRVAVAINASRAPGRWVVMRLAGHKDLTVLQQSQLTFVEIDANRGAESVAAFLSRHTWPFHARPTLTVSEAREIKLGPPTEFRSFWVIENGVPAGLVRAFDLVDAVHGSVLFDIRIATEYRGRGIGRAAVGWLVVKLFTDYPQLHRIEARTRFDNHVMRRALEVNKFVLEGKLRETWHSVDGVRHDTALYGRLRSDA